MAGRFLGDAPGNVPAVSMALRRVDRLRAANIAGVPWKFARKLARPPDCVRDGWAEVIWFRPCWFLVRAGEGLRTKAFFPSEELGYGGLCPHPLRKLSFLRTFLLLPPLRTRGASFPKAGASRDQRGAAPSVTNFAHTRNAPQRTSRHHGGAVRVAPSRQQLAAGTARSPLRTMGTAKLNAGASRDHRGAAPSVTNFARTRNVPQRTSRHHGGAVRVTPSRQQLAAGTARPASSACAGGSCPRGVPARRSLR